jgi:hypothetical protein
VANHLPHEKRTMPDKSLLPGPDVDTQLAIAQHLGYDRAGDEAEDGAVSRLCT